MTKSLQMLKISSLYFGYNPNNLVLEDINLAIKKGEHVGIIGESGCGKSTLLELIYGILQPINGSISWKNSQILGPEYHLVPGEPFIKYLAQDFDLMPYTSVSSNIGNFLSNFFPEEKQERIQELLEVIEMTTFADTHTRYLSGGQKQRVALARALAKEPEILLLDEPFSHIDNFKKSGLRRNLFKYLKERKITCLIATHDITDILSYTDLSIVLRKGKLVAHAKTPVLYQQPKNRYVASLFGEVNELPLHYFSVDALKNQIILLYPNELIVVPSSLCKVFVKNSYFKGPSYCLEATTADATHTIFFEHRTSLPEGESCYLSVDKALFLTRTLLV